MTKYADMERYLHAFLTLVVYRNELQASSGKQPHLIGGCVCHTSSHHAVVSREIFDICRE
jgi:hypothetical protein